MNSRKKALIGLGIAFLVGGIVGLAISGYAGMHMMFSYFGNNWLHEQAEDIQSHIVILRHLRAGKQAQAVELLEVKLDDDVISIEPDKYINARTITDINSAIREAKEYRSTHPRTSNRPHVDAMVTNVFSQEPYKEE
jgi:uncharacterized iron-regulated membrane protein